MRSAFVAAAGLVKLVAAAWGSAAALPEEVFFGSVADFLGEDVHRWLQAGGSLPGDVAARRLWYLEDCRPAGIGQLTPACVSQGDLEVRFYRVGRSVCCYGQHRTPDEELARAALRGQAVRVGLLLQDPRPRPGRVAAASSALLNWILQAGPSSCSSFWAMMGVTGARILKWLKPGTL